MPSKPMTFGLVSDGKNKPRDYADRFSHATAVRVIARSAEKAGFDNAQYANIDITFSNSGVRPEIDWVTRGSNFLVKVRLHNVPADMPLKVFEDAMNSLFHNIKNKPYKVGPDFQKWANSRRH